ncbi:MAG: hypothetical protein EAX90_12355 [Candidatus Heimdallarchaeota archaeon]|nr:hypothetical protein [Candidatus Heimdallarchaeota archaeon]
MSKMEDFIKELDISTFSKPILKEMGVKALFLVTFDIILGPIAYMNKLTTEKIEYLEFLQDLAHLGEFYTGISHAQIDKVTTRTGEEMIVGRATRKVNEIELIDVAVALVESLEYQEDILKMLKFAVRTAYGNPKNFSDLLDRVILEYQDIGKKKAALAKSGSFKELAKDKVQNVAKLYVNWNGILFIDFEADKLNSSFLPDWIEAIKINPQELAQKTREMYQEGVIIPRSKQTFSVVSLKSKQMIVISNSNSRFISLVFPNKEGMTRISAIAESMDILNEAMSEVGLQFNEETMKKTLEIIDRRIINSEEQYLSKEVAAVMVQADKLMPKKTINQEEYEVFEGEMQKRFYSGFGKAFHEFDGTKSVFEITHKVNISLEKMADFVVYCMTRGIVQVFAKNGRN